MGAGIAGIQAALEIADSGHHVYLVEREPSVGGHMSQFDKTFPTLDCAACILTPKMVSAGSHPNITLLSYSEVERVDGYVGSFNVTIRKKARYVNEDACTGCGICEKSCVLPESAIKVLPVRLVQQEQQKIRTRCRLTGQTVRIRRSWSPTRTEDSKTVRAWLPGPSASTRK